MKYSYPILFSHILPLSHLHNKGLGTLQPIGLGFGTQQMCLQQDAGLVITTNALTLSHKSAVLVFQINKFINLILFHLSHKHQMATRVI